MTRWFTALHGLLLAVLFCLPWLTVSCPGPHGRRPGENESTVAGYHLALANEELPLPHAPGTTLPKPAHSYTVLDAPHPFYLLIPIFALGLIALAIPKLSRSSSFRKGMLVLWLGAMLALGLGAWRDYRIYRGDPWDYHLRWEPAFWMTVAALPLAGVWLAKKREIDAPDPSGQP